MRATWSSRVFGIEHRKNIWTTILIALLCTLFASTFFSTETDADVGVIRPDGSGTTLAGTPTGCTSNLNWECLNDVVTQPTLPSTGSDYLTLENTQSNFSTLQTISDVNTVSAITVWYYHVEGGTNAQMTIGLYALNETTAYAGPTGVTTRTSAQWDSVTFTGLALTQTQLDDMRVGLSCTKTGGGGSNTCTGYALYASLTYTKQIEVNVDTAGTQQNVNVGATNAHIGGSFAISSLVGSRNVTSITINETGTVDASTNLKNIKLYYELDTSTPYNCVSETYAGTETQFGTTDTDGFSAANGSSVFTVSPGPVITTTAALCVYVIADVQGGATAAQTVEVEITNPSTQVGTSDSGDVQPATAVALSGTTVLLAPKLDQLHYHWRNDTGSESTAPSATGGTEDTALSTLGKLSPIRLRLEVSNEGNSTSAATQYRLEYAQKISTCSAATGWTDVGAGGGDWDMYDSSNLTNGNNTTNIIVGTGGVTDSPAHTFLTTNAGVRDTTSQTGNLTLTSTQFVELEYSLQSTSASTEGYTYCFRVTNAGTPIDAYSVYPEATILADVNVSPNGTQHATVDIPTTDTDVGAHFVFTDNIAGDTTVTSITITASGTVDYQNDLDNIELWYDLDITGADSYNCSDHSFNGNETQFGSTDTDGFSAGGISTFTGSRVINPTQSLCLYVVYDVLSSVSNDETLDIKIDNAATDVVISSGSVSPAALVDLAGMTTFIKTDLSVVHYHWRHDDESESGATSETGNEDTVLTNLRQTIPTRLRFGVANEGSASTPSQQFRLEYALNVSTCSTASGWTDVGAIDDAFNMFDSVNITDGSNTTNIGTSTGGVTDVGTTFITSNSAVKDTSSQVASLVLPGKNFVDLEYSIVASTTATLGGTYCFRVSNAGTALPTYDVYPELTIKGKTDFFTQRNFLTITGNSATINAGTDYVAPLSSTTAFIRITDTLNTGAGTGATGNADDVTVYISDPSNIESSITFTRPTGALGSTRVSWEIIEYVGAPGGDNEITVRQQSTATYDSANTTVSTPTVSGIQDDADVAVFITGQLNPDTGTNYPYGNSTSAWNAGSDTATFTRGASGNASGVSYAVVEFVGTNWVIQRNEHTYSAVGTTETGTITAVNSLSRAFVHSQKRMGTGLNTHGDFGHQVWLSGLNQVSYTLDSTAGSPGSHTSVAWVIENTQTIGTTMVVTQSGGIQSGGASPATVNVNIGKTISDTQDASIFMNNFGNEPGGGGGQNSFPEPMMAARLISTTQYELWVADTSDSRSWRAEVVEWPTAARDIAQNYYRFYVDNDALDPTDPWPVGVTDLGENTEVTGSDGPIAYGESVRIRMTLQVSAAEMTAGLDSFKLQYGERSSTCSAIPELNWHNIGDVGSTTALWRGTSGTPADGTNLSTDPPAVGALNISVVDVAGTYEESNPTAFTPFDVIPGDDIEYDWNIQHNGATEKTDYCFRMLEAGGILFDQYNFYPTMQTAGFGVESLSWIWYDDENNLSPTTTLAATNTAPIDIDFDNNIVLRTTLQEIYGADGTGAKFRLQFSESPNFSTSTDVAEIGDCTSLSYWCYTDGAGLDNATVTAKRLADADSCTAGVGNGCGSYNESGTSTSSFIQTRNSAAEYSFTLKNSGARTNRVYYFRLYDMLNDEVVPLGATESYPSVVTKGASLVFSVDSLASSTVIEGVTLDIDTTPTEIHYGTVPVNTFVEGAHRLYVDANGTEGYKLFMLLTSDLTSPSGDTILPITATNASPLAWNTGCDANALSCFGYHTSDDTLEGGSTRFSAIDTYARFSTTTLEEVSYSSQPVINESTDIIFRILVRQLQQPGNYESSIMYVSVPIF